ncbi:MAG: family 1 glycosylhydrolase [Verrucomicrobia bacterium]|nr:family 1 glycosylhydrolase [Verrucomicrobiota bacterium]
MDSLQGYQFRWASGIEGSVIPHLGIDQFAWTQHDRFWRQDLALAAQDLGCVWIRYPLVWTRLEPEPGQFNWDWADERLEAAAKAGLNLILDLVHFGVPEWLPEAVGDIDFPRALERFTEAFADRYSGHPAIASICPVNEPLTTAFFCGDAGLWPPFGRGLQDYMTVLRQIAEALVRSIRVLRAKMPGTEILMCDSLEVATTEEPSSSERTSPFLLESLGADVARRMERRHLAVDLVTGRVGPRHFLWDWLRQNGFSRIDLLWFRQNAQEVDVIGLDYYNHTEVEILTSPEGHYLQRIARNPLGLYRAAQDYWHRYHRPLMITETSATGSNQMKLDWLERCVSDIRRLRADGFPVIGYTWWPLIDHLDWDGAMRHQTGHIHPVGIYALRREADGTLRREATELTKAYRQLVAGADESSGPLRLNKIDKRQSILTKTNRRGDNNGEPVGRPILAFGSERWSEVWRRTNYLLAALSRRHLIVYLSIRRGFTGTEPSVNLVHPRQNLIAATLTVAATGDPDGLKNQALLQQLITYLLRSPSQEPAVWYADLPAYKDFGSLFPSGRKILDLDSTDPTSEDSVAAIRRIDAVLLRCPTQIHSIPEEFGSKVLLVEDGVDLRFIKARRPRTVLPTDSRFIRRPALGFIGSIDSRIDLELIDRLAETTSLWTIVMIGPVRDIAPEILPRRENIYWIGARDHSLLGNYCRGMDVAILPFKTNQPRQTLPTQLRQSLLADLPVVALGLASLERDYSGWFDSANSHDEFVDLCRQRLEQKEPERRAKLRKLVASRSWNQVAREVEAVVG